MLKILDYAREERPMLNGWLCLIRKKYRKAMHRHKYETLSLYPPRSTYRKDSWGFLLRCECGKVKLARLPSGIRVVEEVHSNIEKVNEIVRT